MSDSRHNACMTKTPRHAPPGTYPNHVKAWRQFRGMTQEQVADLTGLAEGTLSLLENGRTGFTRPTLQKLSNALTVPIADLIGTPPGAPDAAEVRSLVEATLALPEPRRTRTIEIIQRLVEPEPAAEPASPPKGRRRSA